MLIILRKISLIFVLFCSFTTVCSAVNEPETSAMSAVLIDGDTRQILYDKNSDEKRSMASTTKIMTSLIAIESGKLGKTVKIKDKPYIEGTAIGFNKGDKVTLETLCYAMLLESGNDAAVLTAEYLAGSEEKFSIIMNSKAREIGMSNTNFVTASGLDAEEHYTTAYDMACLGSYAVKNEKFKEICGTKNFKAEFIEPEITRYFSNHNRLLSSCDGVIGIKTGFTKKSGRCLVSACERNGKLLVAVTLNAPDDWNDHKKLFDYGYSLYDYISIPVEIPDEIDVFGSCIRKIQIKAANQLNVYALKNSEISTKVILNRLVYAPVRKNDIIGKTVVLQNGSVITEMNIISADDADVLQNHKIYKPSFFSRILNLINPNKRKVEKNDRR